MNTTFVRKGFLLTRIFRSLFFMKTPRQATLRMLWLSQRCVWYHCMRFLSRNATAIDRKVYEFHNYSPGWEFRGKDSLPVFVLMQWILTSSSLIGNNLKSVIFDIQETNNITVAGYLNKSLVLTNFCIQIHFDFWWVWHPW